MLDNPGRKLKKSIQVKKQNKKMVENCCSAVPRCYKSGLDRLRLVIPSFWDLEIPSVRLSVSECWGRDNFENK